MASKTLYEQPLTLPLIGHLRWTQIEPFLPVCRETWRKMGHAGRAPRPIRLSPRCTIYQAQEIHRWLADPLNYQVAG